MERAGELAGKNILIIGGLGLIGSTTARLCIARGARVTLVSHQPLQSGVNDFNLADFEGKFEFIAGDVREKSFVDLIVRERDYIFNFAAQVNHNISIEDPILDNELNCIGHINVLMGCKNFNPAAKLIYPGSRLQYGRIHTLPVTEEHPREPLSFYAIHKNAAEQYYQTFFHHYGIRSTCFRITNPYGPRSQMKNSGHSLINWFIRQAMDNRPITIYGEGRQIRDYVYIDDLVEGIVLSAASNTTDGRIYNLGSGVPTKFLEMAELVVTSVGQGSIVHVPWPKGYDHFETGDFYADISKMKRETGWIPQTDLQSGIEQTVAFYRAYRSRYW